MKRPWIRASADIETTQAEEALRESQQLLQQVIATMPVGVIVTDRAGDMMRALDIHDVASLTRYAIGTGLISIGS
jgi:signal transduction histidine kinase